MKFAPKVVSLVVAGAVLLAAGCASGSDDPDASGAAGRKTFTLALAADPGALDPSMSAVSTLFWMSRFAYDSLVGVDLKGNVLPQLASDWTQTADQVTLTIKDGVTCADGTAFTAQTAADNINFISDPDNQSPLLGAFLPGGIEAEADGSTLTLNLSAPAPFILTGLSDLVMVCDAGLADRTTLAAATNGSGPYVLKEAVPNDHYTYTLREGYTWGPGGATTTEPKMPGEVVVRIIENETTAANLLLSQEINAAIMFGAADAERLTAANLFSLDVNSVIGEQWYNEGDGHFTADPAVRQALVQAVDLSQLRQVITSNKGTDATAFETSDPVPCPGDYLAAVKPKYDVAAAEAALDAAGYTLGADGIRAKDGQPLQVTFLYDASLGDPAGAAAELAVAAWTAVGFDVQAQQLPSDQLAGILFGSGAWDIAWEPLNVSTPEQIVGFMSGPGVAEGGTNFGNIANDAYSAGVAAAMTEMGSGGCSLWQQASAELVKANDVTPFANNVTTLFGAGAEFERVASIIPTSIRMAD